MKLCSKWRNENYETSSLDYLRLDAAVNLFLGCVYVPVRVRVKGGDGGRVESAARFPETAALIIGGTSDFVLRWQMVG